MGCRYSRRLLCGFTWQPSGVAGGASFNATCVSCFTSSCRLSPLRGFIITTTVMFHSLKGHSTHFTCCSDPHTHLYVLNI